LRVALVYDRVNKVGGAERVLGVLGEIFPQAPLYTAFFDPKGAPWAKRFKVITSPATRFPLFGSFHELFPWLTPFAFESLDFSDFDLVISVTSAEAKGIITRPGTFHLCYCLTPTRYLWSGYREYFRSKAIRLLARPLVNALKRWDLIAAQRPDAYLAISGNVRKRIRQYYQRDSKVIYPPIDLDKWRPLGNAAKDKYFLIVSRLVAYKKIDIAIEAFNQLGLSLKVVGIGRQMGGLRKMAKDNIEFLGQLTDKELLGYYQRSLAVIYPQEEDFGLVPLEAQACGTPVIAYRGGGALESVIEGKTGLFFSPQNANALVDAVKKFEALRLKIKTEDSHQNAQKFSKEIFKKNFREIVGENVGKI
jgi:glycosyltransferase involved in cell wall biosynthesis